MHYPVTAVSYQYSKIYWYMYLASSGVFAQIVAGLGRVHARADAGDAAAGTLAGDEAAQARVLGRGGGERGDQDKGDGGCGSRGHLC